MIDIVTLTRDGSTRTITLNDPERRNAMSIALFDGLDDIIGQLQAEDDADIIIVRGAGKAFCAGFDLGAAVEEPECMATFIRRLSEVIRRLRRLPGIVVMAVHGAAIAGGCALVTAGDVVIVTRDAKLGYPVHAIGVSPAVTTPSLSMAIGDGPARAMLLGGELITGDTAGEIGLATHVVEAAAFDDAVQSIVDRLLTSGANARRMTKSWLNTLDGSDENARFDGPAEGSCDLTTTEESRALLERFWARRSSR